MKQSEIVKNFQTGDNYSCRVHNGKTLIKGKIVIQQHKVYFLHNNKNADGSRPIKMLDGYKHGWVYTTGIEDIKVWKDIPKEQVVDNYEIY